MESADTNRGVRADTSRVLPVESRFVFPLTRTPLFGPQISQITQVLWAVRHSRAGQKKPNAKWLPAF